MKKLFLIFFLLGSLLKIPAQVNPVDSASFMDMYYSWDLYNCSYPDYTQVPILPANQWPGVFNWNSNGRLITIGCPFQNCINGPINQSIANLTELEYFLLHYTQNSGTIIPEVGLLTKLKVIDFQFNDFSGSIPDEICNLTNLVTVFIRESPAVSGPLPTNIGNLTELNTLLLTGLGINGNIPVSVQNLDSLEGLSIAYCPRFGGNIPNFICSMNHLYSLDLKGCAFNGDIPQDIGNMSSLGNLELDSNFLTGPIPSSLCEVSDRYIYVTLSNNDLDEIPIFQLATLGYSVYFKDIRFNKFTFEDFEPLVQNGAIQQFECGTYYSAINPQDSVWSYLDTTVIVGTPVHLNSTVGGTANVYQWYKNGVAIPGASSPILYAPAVNYADSGIYTCRIANTIVTPATSLILDRYEINVHVVDTLTSSNLYYANKPELAPNPFSENITIKLNNSATTETTITLFSYNGSKLKSFTTRKTEIVIDTANLPAGLYFVKIQSGDKVFNYKLAKE